MGRIDEALRRGGATGAERTGRSLSAVDVFVSPWAVAPEAEHAHVAGGPSREEAPAKEPLAKEPLAKEPRVDLAPLREAGPSLLDGFKKDWRERLAVSAAPNPLLVDQFRRLAATLLHNPTELKTVLITSACPGDGKTLTALNLALVLSGSYRRRVLLIEGDLRRPAIAEAAGVPKVSGGLSEILKAPEDRKVTLVQLSDMLTLMPAGRPDPDPLSGLTSPRFQRLLQEASEQYDWVILDTPPLGAAPDASLMLPFVDAALLVIRARTTPYAVVQRAVETLGADRILGIVLNAVGADVVSGYDYYYGQY